MRIHFSRLICSESEIFCRYCLPSSLHVNVKGQHGLFCTYSIARKDWPSGAPDSRQQGRSNRRFAICWRVTVCCTCARHSACPFVSPVLPPAGFKPIAGISVNNFSLLRVLSRVLFNMPHRRCCVCSLCKFVWKHAWQLHFFEVFYLKIVDRTACNCFGFFYYNARGPFFMLDENTVVGCYHGFYFWVNNQSM